MDAEREWVVGFGAGGHEDDAERFGRVARDRQRGGGEGEGGGRGGVSSDAATAVHGRGRGVFGGRWELGRGSEWHVDKPASAGGAEECGDAEAGIGERQRRGVGKGSERLERQGEQE